MPTYRLAPALACILLLAAASPLKAAQPAASVTASDTTSAGSTLLKPQDLENLIPKAVFFRGQSAPIQLRNAGGIKFADGMYTFATLVDTSGYSTGVQAKYQAYFVTEIPLQLDTHLLPPGAYGVGFLADRGFLVMDIGAHDLFTTASTRDQTLRRPVPLQIVAGTSPGTYRLYEGRTYVEFHRAAR